MWTPFEIFSKSIASTVVSLWKPSNYIKMDEKEKSLSLIEKILEKMLSKAKVKELMEKYRAIFNPKYAIIIECVFELGLLIYDYSKANSSKCQEKFKEVMIKRFCAAICSLPGFWLGYYLSGMLSVAICGWAPLAVLVSIVVGALCDFLAKEAGGQLAVQVVLPLVKGWCLEAKIKSE